MAGTRPVRHRSPGRHIALLLALGLSGVAACGDGGDAPTASASTAPAGSAAGAGAAAGGAGTTHEVATPDDLERALRLGAHREVAEEATALLASPDAAELDAADRWRVRRVQLIALAWHGDRGRLAEAWDAAAGEHAREQLAALAGQIAAGLAEDGRGEGPVFEDVVVRGGPDRDSFLAGVLLRRADLTDPDAWRRTREEAVRRARLPYGHPEGFPKAWLAPDERPEGR